MSAATDAPRADSGDGVCNLVFTSNIALTRGFGSPRIVNGAVLGVVGTIEFREELVYPRSGGVQHPTPPLSLKSNPIAKRIADPLSHPPPHGDGGDTRVLCGFSPIHQVVALSGCVNLGRCVHQGMMTVGTTPRFAQFRTAWYAGRYTTFVPTTVNR